MVVWSPFSKSERTRLEESRSMKRLVKVLSRSFFTGASVPRASLTRSTHGGSFATAPPASREGILTSRATQESSGVSNYKNMYDSLVEMYSISEGTGGGVISVTRFIDVSI